MENPRQKSWESLPYWTHAPGAPYGSPLVLIVPPPDSVFCDVCKEPLTPPHLTGGIKTHFHQEDMTTVVLELPCGCLQSEAFSSRWAGVDIKDKPCAAHPNRNASYSFGGYITIPK